MDFTGLEFIVLVTRSMFCPSCRHISASPRLRDLVYKCCSPDPLFHAFFLAAQPVVGGCTGSRGDAPGVVLECSGKMEE